MRSNPERTIQKSLINVRHNEADHGGPYTVHLDEILSRRKRFHMIADQTGCIVWRSKYVGDILDWLAHREQFEVRIFGEGLDWVCSFRRGSLG